MPVFHGGCLNSNSSIATPFAQARWAWRKDAGGEPNTSAATMPA